MHCHMQKYYSCYFWQITRLINNQTRISNFHSFSKHFLNSKINTINSSKYISHIHASHLTSGDTSKTIPELQFRNPRVAHISKTNLELLRGWFIFRLCSVPFLVKHNKKIIDCTRSILGKALFRKFMQITFYGHFVAGEDQEQIKPIVKRMRKYGVKSILDYSVEKDIMESEAVIKVKQSLEEVVSAPEIRPDAAPKQFQTSLQFANRSKYVVGARTYFYESEKQCDENMETFVRCIDAVQSATSNEGFAAIKLTALGRPQLLRIFSVMILDRKTGTAVSSSPLVSLDLDNFRRQLNNLGVEISYNDDIKWFTVLDISGDGVIDLLDWSHLKTFEHDLASLLTIRNKKTGQMEQLVPRLTPEGLEEMRNMIKRIDALAQHAKSSGVRIMIDAEQTYFQPAIRRLTMEMMRIFNKDNAVVFNTCQCYLKDARENLVQDLHHAEVTNFFFGAKLVRGAYMEQERARAKELNYPDPICTNFEATSQMYESCLDESLSYMKKRPKGKVAIMIATHNEDTINFVLRRMKETNIAPDERLICFGQLFGMCDHLSFPLGHAGYSVYKYVPYGPVDDVLPYLSRRATENGSILAKTKIERQLIRSELGRRLRHFDFFHKP